MSDRVKLAAAAVLAALCAGAPAAAATVALAQNESLIVTLRDVSSATLSFALPTTGGYANYGGYIKWSTREDGRLEGDGPWGTCYECGHHGGDWALWFDPWNTAGSRAAAEVRIDFGGQRDVVHLWVRATYGAGTLTYPDARALPETTAPAVPLPAGVALLATALAGLGLAGIGRRRRAA